MSQPMSLEAMLDEERREVLSLLEGPRRSGGASGAPRAASPPVRSMLDISDTSPRQSTSSTVTPIRSMLDIDVPATVPRHTPTSPAESSPLSPVRSRTGHPRTSSDASAHPPSVSLRSPTDRGNRNDPTSAYQFSGYLPSNPGGPSIPKRNTQGGKHGGKKNAMAEALRGDMGTSMLDPIARQALGVKSKSRSPHNRLAIRSQSPHSSMLAVNSPPLPNHNLAKYTLSDGTPVDVNSAYRRLSDANLAMSGGSLASLPKGRRRAFSGGEADGVMRLEKDYVIDELGEAGLDSSDEAETSDDENPRGRAQRSNNKDLDHPESQTLGMGRAKGPRQSLSLLAAAEEERQQIASEAASQYHVRSLLEPEITITGPAGDRLRPQKATVHPSTAFDQTPSGVNTPLDSEEEGELTDIKRAQKLSVNMTGILSTPETQRCVRTIFRGDFAQMQQEAEDDQRRVRKYLVATDLSDEAAHALEWTVGTVLRDGDTLLCIYCVDEEAGVIGNDGIAMKDQAEIIASTAINPPSVSAKPLPSGSNVPSPSPGGREQTRAEQERFRAVQDITDRITKLLRRTKLQVRVVIEVIHCKSPKHLITEIIDFLSPTLVILGSRGRSALKGVILGSFSNYLVTKSSVPVMVARKRLRKHSKYKRPTKLANNLMVSEKRLASAKID